MSGLLTMSELLTQPWPYAVLFTALVLGRRLKFWGPGFGVEVNHGPDPGKSGPDATGPAQPGPKAPSPKPTAPRSSGKGKKSKRGKK